MASISIDQNKMVSVVAGLRTDLGLLQARLEGVLPAPRVDTSKMATNNAFLISYYAVIPTKEESGHGKSGHPASLPGRFFQRRKNSAVEEYTRCFCDDFDAFALPCLTLF